MRVIRIIASCLLIAASMATPAAQSDLDALMERVLARRDDNWKKLQTADGDSIGEDDRRSAETRWRLREERREKRRGNGGDDAEKSHGQVTLGPGGVDVQFETAMRDALEPGFVSAAYFLNFKFEAGRYALVGRDAHLGRPVLLIEYYPTLMLRKDGHVPTGRSGSATRTSSGG